MHAKEAGECCNVPRLLSSFLNRDDAPPRKPEPSEDARDGEGVGSSLMRVIMPDEANGWDGVLVQ